MLAGKKAESGVSVVVQESVFCILASLVSGSSARKGLVRFCVGLGYDFEVFLDPTSDQNAYMLFFGFQ